MGEIVHFVGKPTLSAKENLEKFIAHAQANFPFSNVEWNDNSWDISTFAPDRNQGKKRKIVLFRSMRDDNGNKPIVSNALNAPFLNFAKAAFCEIMRRSRLQEFRRYIYAMQAVEQALHNLKLPACVTSLNPNVLDEAASLLVQRFNDAWSAGRCLERLVQDIILPAYLTPRQIAWKSSILYKTPTRNDKIGHAGTERANKRLPQVKSILDLAEIHHTSNHVPDKVTTSFVTLAMFAPSRCSEILTLPVDCITGAESDNGALMGIRWTPSKDGAPLTKFSTTESFGEVVKDTIDYLKVLGAPARLAAKWYAKNPQSLYLPHNLEHLRGSAITLWEAAQILGKKTAIHSSHAKRYELEKLPFKLVDKTRNEGHTNHPMSAFTFESLEQFVLKKLPANFPVLDPITGLMWHDALYVLPEHIFRPNAELLLHVPTPLSTNQINNQLGANPDGVTIFTRHGKTLPDGSPAAITTHQFRHLLNTLAQSKHLSESLIAFWSGRKSIGQNEWYDHLPQEAFIEAYLSLGEQVPTLHVHGPLEQKISSVASANMLTRQEAHKVELGAIHMTRFGICRHDYALTPCPKDKDCNNCGEFAFVKGDQRHFEEAIYQADMLRNALKRAHTALQEGDAGASKWIALNAPKLERWEMVLQKMNDATIPNGAVISLPPPKNSQSKTGLAEAARNGKRFSKTKEDDELDKVLQNLELF